MQRVLDKTAGTCGKSMVDHLRFRLRSIFELALSEGVVDRNPALALFTPRQVKSGRARNVLTPEQSDVMIGALGLREQIVVRLATWEGMRPGEILAVQFGDLEGDCLWVRRRLYKGNLDTPRMSVRLGRFAYSGEADSAFRRQGDGDYGMMPIALGAKRR